jgi:hypothetical protein
LAALATSDMPTLSEMAIRTARVFSWKNRRPAVLRAPVLGVVHAFAIAPATFRPHSNCPHTRGSSERAGLVGDRAGTAQHAMRLSATAARIDQRISNRWLSARGRRS